jgi:hypothetical protein
MQIKCEYFFIEKSGQSLVFAKLFKLGLFYKKNVCRNGGKKSIYGLILALHVCV